MNDIENKTENKAIEDQANEFVKSAEAKLNPEDKNNQESETEKQDNSIPNEFPQMSTEQGIEMVRIGLRKYYQSYRPDFPMYEFLIDIFCKSSLACCKKYGLDKSTDLPIEIAAVGSGVILLLPLAKDIKDGKIKLNKKSVDKAPSNIVKEETNNGNPSQKEYNLPS